MITTGPAEIDPNIGFNSRSITGGFLFYFNFSSCVAAQSILDGRSSGATQLWVGLTIKPTWPFRSVDMRGRR